MSPGQVGEKHEFGSKIAGGCSSYDVVAPWPDVTWSIFLKPKFAQYLPHKVPWNPAALRTAIFFAIREKPQGGGAPSEVVSYCSPMNSALHRHLGPIPNEHAASENNKISSTQS